MTNASNDLYKSVPSAAVADDDVLLQAAQQGDMRALETLLTRLRPKLTRLVLSMVKSPGDAEEVVQDACLQVFRSLPRYVAQNRGAQVARAWIFRIAVNLALMHLRRRRRQPILALGDGFAPLADDALLASPPPSWAPSPDDAAALSERGAQVDGILARLPDKYRLVLWLVDVEGHSNDEVADELGLTLPTVKARLHRARHAARQLAAASATSRPRRATAAAATQAPPLYRAASES